MQNAERPTSRVEGLLSDALVRAIRASSGSYSEITERFGVSKRQCANIKTRRTYRDVPDEFVTNRGEVLRGVGIFGSL